MFILCVISVSVHVYDTYYICICSSVGGQLGCFHNSVIASNAEMDRGRCPFELVFLDLGGKYPVGHLLGHRATPFSTS